MKLASDTMLKKKKVHVGRRGSRDKQNSQFAMRRHNQCISTVSVQKRDLTESWKLATQHPQGAHPKLFDPQVPTRGLPMKDGCGLDMAADKPHTILQKTKIGSFAVRKRRTANLKKTR